MNDLYYIEFCRQLLAQKENLEHWDNWTLHHYTQLKENIYLATKTELSISTLERFFGRYTKDNAVYIPRAATKNILAQYLGYKNWNDFIVSNKKENNTSRNNSQQSIFRKINIPITLIILSILVVVVTIFLIWTNINTQPSTRPFISTNTPVVKAPSSVEFNYDVKAIKEDSVYIHYGNGSIRYDAEKLNKNGTTVIHDFVLPGIFNVKVFSNKTSYNSLQLLVINKDWKRHIASPEKNVISELPYTNELSIRKEELSIYKFDTSSYFQTDYRLFDTLNFSLDDFTLETRIKKDPSIKRWMSCHFESIKIYSFNSSIKINFTDLGCSEKAHFFVSDNRVSGKQANYKQLSMNLTEWHDVKLVVKNKRATLYVDGIENMSMSYTDLMGNFCGIQYLFSQTGMVSFLKLYNDKGLLIYDKTFSEE